MTTRTPFRTEQVRAWNATATDYPRDALVDDLFEEVALRSPDSVAFEPETGPPVTYGELRGRVRALAASLQARGVGAGDTVGVLMERSVDAYVAILAILRAGGAFVPVDVTFPPDRVATILSDAGCRLVVTEDHHLPLVPSGVQVVQVDACDGDPEGPQTTERTALSPAYVMYTSGSTGAPKGVVVPHRGVVRLVRDTDLIVYQPSDVVCGTVNLTFDMSVLELFGTVLNGARMIVPTQDTLLAPTELEDLLRARRVTVMWLGAALFHQMAADRPAMFSSLRCLIAGGDALNPAAVRAVLVHGKPGQLVDGYGPTENTCLSTAHVIDDLPAEAESVPIGRPISNSTAYVVRDDGSPASPGEEGELWVGGDGVALGYLNRPEQTSERFVPDRFSGTGEGRLYRTGDMARWRPDGVIEFLGRRDRQVKLKGFRVELREIEIVLASHPAVKEAVVAVREGTDHLLGWVVADQDTGAGRTPRSLPMRLRQYLRDRLPVFMVPQEVKVVASMPVNASGKVDRAALSETADHREQDEVPAEERPHGATEEAIAESWRRVLGVGTVRRDDDFFDLGGQSLQATQVVSTVSGQLGVDGAHARALVGELLKSPTVAGLAEKIDRLRHAENAAPAGAGASADELLADAALPASMSSEAPPVDAPGAPRDVLLIGSTGFLGVFLLDRLVAAGTERVLCLVRANDADHARRRIAGRMRRYGLDYDRVRDHVVPLVGDTSRPLLGLSEAEFDALAARVDAIVHSGSLINFAYTYQQLRGTNVEGVRTLLDLATRHRLTPFHHVSTIITLVGYGVADDRYVMEDRPLAYPEHISLGYAESKWVAERLVAEAGRRGLPVAVYRPYEISGTRDRGVWNTDTLMCAWWRTIAETGLSPRVELPLDLVPVDYTAEAIVHILRTQSPDGRAYNLTNPNDARLSLVDERLRNMGYPVQEISYADWAKTVTERCQQDPHHPMTPFMLMFNENSSDPSLTVKEMYFAETFPEFSRTNTIRATDDAGLDLPPVDASLVDRYLGYFISSGFLNPPPEEPGGELGARIPLVPGNAEEIRQWVKHLQPRLAAHVRENPLYPLILGGRLRAEHLERFVVSELHAQPAEIAAFERLARRFDDSAASALFHDVAEAITGARPGLIAAADALGIDRDGVVTPTKGATAFADFVSWLAADTGPGAAAAALRADLMLWCAVCAELARELDRRPDVAPPEVTRYVRGYALAPPAVLRAAADVVAAAVEDGESPDEIERVTGRVEPVLRTYWTSVASDDRL
ncbi:amino acid adenylation domain-containing protein [Actinomadura sp. KC06]|uniref:amino acid adenylation domain-containing protein n=1 Tax=Actinomadura sp. KC06 TaxID=2530369 RepID=UPI00105027B9|nr:amino acid adenylation domain-containing protein [Actinomadura sp. KC06]TDD28033.1 amino acid adenylation domain-containing protein [Actinomadura sp. KC06]